MSNYPMKQVEAWVWDGTNVKPLNPQVVIRAEDPMGNPATIKCNNEPSVIKGHCILLEREGFGITGIMQEIPDYQALRQEDVEKLHNRLLTVLHTKAEEGK